MATELHAPSRAEQGLTVEEQIAHLRELFADAPEVGRKAFENVFKDLTAQASQTPPPPVKSAGRVGSAWAKSRSSRSSSRSRRAAPSGRGRSCGC